MNRRFFVCLSIVALGVAAYANSLEGPFLYDDHDAIVRNMSIRNLWPPWRAAWGPRTSPMAGRPVVNLSLAFNYAIGGLDPRGYRVFNLVVHLVCATLLFGIVDRSVQNRRTVGQSGRHGLGLAAACAMLWLLHPMHTECVNYVTQRTESMMALCYLLTLFCAIRARDERGRSAWSIAAVAACAVGMATKETMITAPIMVLLYDWAYRAEPFRQTLRRRWPLYAALAATWGALAALMATGPRSNTVGFELGVGAIQYALNQCVVVVDYLRLAVWPFPIALDYGEPRDISFAHAAPYAITLATLIAAAFAALVLRPAVGFAAIWFFAVLAPTSSIVPIASEVGAERRVYLPSAGLIVLGAVCVGWLLVRAEDALIRRSRGPDRKPGRMGRRCGTALVVALAAVMLFATARRNLDYDDPIILWRAAIEAVPQNPRAHVNLGIALAETGDQQAAVAKFHDALKIEPLDPEAHYNLGNALSLAGHLDEAIMHYEVAIDSAAKEGGRWPVAQMRRWLDALRGAEDDAARHMSFARLLSGQNRIDEVIIHYDHAVRLRPDWAEPQARLAWILATSANDARRDATRALELARSAVKLTGERDPLILDVLAAAYAEAGRFDDAVATAQRAIELARAAGRDKWIETMRRHLEHYRGNEPWHE